MLPVDKALQMKCHLKFFSMFCCDFPKVCCSKLQVCAHLHDLQYLDLGVHHGDVLLVDAVFGLALQVCADAGLARWVEQGLLPVQDHGGHHLSHPMDRPLHVLPWRQARSLKTKTIGNQQVVSKTLN